MRVRVTGRFYLLLLLIALIILFLFRGQIFGTNEVAVIYRGSAQDSRTVQGVIVRDETLVSENLVTRMEFAVDELGSVNEGDTVAYVYSLEYSTRLINEMNAALKCEMRPVELLKGEYLRGSDGFIEFHPDEDALMEWVLEVFYKQVQE